jgi:thiol-disulfide isomerase/thioredoxin
MALLRSMILTALLFSYALLKAQVNTEAVYRVSEVKAMGLTNSRSGKPVRIDINHEAKNIFVIVFLSPECPLCQQYTLQLNDLAQTYANEAAFIGLFPGKSYDRKTITAFLKKYKVKFPAYTDGSKKLTHYLDASVTPEVVVLTKEREGLKLQYRGAIDDRVISLRTKKLSASNDYLKDAISHILLKKEIAIKKTEPVGCLINDF